MHDEFSPGQLNYRKKEVLMKKCFKFFIWAYNAINIALIIGWIVTDNGGLLLIVALKTLLKMIGFSITFIVLVYFMKSFHNYEWNRNKSTLVYYFIGTTILATTRLVMYYFASFSTVNAYNANPEDLYNTC